jgi:hypothetical protein
VSTRSRARRAEWRIVPASTIGPNHVRLGAQNQDAMKCDGLPSGGYVLAVADGAGSQPRAAHGALVAVESAVDAARHLFGRRLPTDTGDWRTAADEYADLCVTWFDERIASVVEELHRQGVQRGGAPTVRRAEFATTLLTVVMAPPWYCCVSVGDGFVVVGRDPGGAHLVVPPPVDRGDAGQTVFLTSPTRAEWLRSEVLYDPAVYGVALCTDGLIEGLLDYDRSPTGELLPVAPETFGDYFRYFAKPTADANDLTRKLLSEEFAGTSGDDKTMVLAVRR